MPLLFSYGTLQRDDVQRSTFGRLLQGEPDELVGFERSLLRIADPAEVAASGMTNHAIVKFNGRDDCRVRGTVYELSDGELASADAYEPPEYARVATTLASGKQAWVYADARPSGRCVAVVGPGEDAGSDAIDDAEALGGLLAGRGWVTLCGGRAAGVMAAVARGVTAAEGIVIGLLPGTDRSAAAPALTVALPTGLGEARNALLVTAADAVIGCGLNPGTVSELALALRAGKPTALVRPTPDAAEFFRALASDAPFCVAETPGAAVAWVERHLATPARRTTDDR